MTVPTSPSMLEWTLAIAATASMLASLASLWHYRRRLIDMAHILLHTTQQIEEQSHALCTPIPAHPHTMLEELRRLQRWTIAQRRHSQSLAEALANAQAQLHAQARAQDIVLASQHACLQEHYRTVIGYADYLDEHIAQKSEDPSIRFDFDDVCESAFNLKLIAGALNLLRNAAPPAARFHLCDLLRPMLISLAPSLDRRAMHFSSQGIDVKAEAHLPPTALSYAIWIILLGIIRYAAPESTLTLHTLSSAHGGHQLAITLSELAPATLTPHERAAHLERCHASIAPAMFVETIRTHANIQLASLLLMPHAITLDVRAQDSTSCTILCDFPPLPSAP